MNDKQKAEGAIKLQRKLEKQAREGIASGKGEGIGLVTIYQGNGGLSDPKSKYK